MLQNHPTDYMLYANNDALIEVKVGNRGVAQISSSLPDEFRISRQSEYIKLAETINTDLSKFANSRIIPGKEAQAIQITTQEMGMQKLNSLGVRATMPEISGVDTNPKVIQGAVFLAILNKMADLHQQGVKSAFSLDLAKGGQKAYAPPGMEDILAQELLYAQKNGYINAERVAALGGYLGISAHKLTAPAAAEHAAEEEQPIEKSGARPETPVTAAAPVVRIDSGKSGPGDRSSRHMP